MINLFVNYDLAVQLKNKGFDVPCMKYFYTDKKSHWAPNGRVANRNIYENQFNQPLYAEVINWLDSKGFVIEIDFSDTESKYGFQYTICLKGDYDYNDLEMRHSAKRVYNFKEYFATRHECYTKAIKESLNLIL